MLCAGNNEILKYISRCATHSACSYVEENTCLVDKNSLLKHVDDIN